jgi:hypothetical protein
MDVDAVDFRGIRVGHGPGDGVREYAFVEPLALGRRDGLGIRHAGNVSPGVEDHGGCHHRAGEAAATHFVHARDVHEPDAPQRVLERAHRGNACHRR